MSHEKPRVRCSENHRRYSSDAAAINIYSRLLRDFQLVEGDNFYDAEHQQLLTNVKEFRAMPERAHGLISVGRFKRAKQMEALLKKYRFKNDAFTDDELSKKTLNGFLDVQNRVHQPMPLKHSGFLVLQRARLICKRILGDYSEEEVVENVRFGRKSSIGCPYRVAYLDEKLSRKEAFTGTIDTAKFFHDRVLPGDHILERILANHHDIDDIIRGEQCKIDYLNLVEVPKTWKAYRLITPLTLLGLFYSYGVGRVVQSRLEDSGLDIRRLQARHRSLVKGFSESLTSATADLSAASDSITSELLMRILPRPWYNALKKTFVRHLIVDDKLFSTASVLPMGNGATFPVETLVFYSLIKAIGELTNIRGIYSVYGDDLIYPSRLHKYVVKVFGQLHLVLNLDKTFVSYPFRESCGSDFYRGEDVRPFFIKGEASMLSNTAYQAFLYQVYNGLRLRWHDIAIYHTLSWILTELAQATQVLLRVPPSYPEYSGIRVETADEVPLSFNSLNWSPITSSFSSGSRWFSFAFLKGSVIPRLVADPEPYYWLALQGLNDEIEDEKAYTGATTHALLLELAESIVRLPVAARASTKRSSLKYQRCVYKRSKVVNGQKVEWKEVVNKAIVDSRRESTFSLATTRSESISFWL